MIKKNPMQFKAFIKKIAAEKKISAQLVLQNYMLERLLERISLSKFTNNFILKGGFLISVILGLDTRATLDLDVTVKGFTLSNETIQKIFSEICSIKLDDNIFFEVLNVSDIRENDDYPGSRVALKANYENISVPLSVDVTTGDIITPSEIQYSYSLTFEDRTIKILAYNVETILAEKIETVLSRNIANTRIRDFYDIHILYSLRGTECSIGTLKQALKRTAEKRGSIKILENYADIIKEIKNNQQLQNFWQRYQKNFDYAKDISFQETCDSVLNIMDKISKL